MKFVTRDARIQAVLSRNSEAADEFVFSNGVTGMYCRPNCPVQPRDAFTPIQLFDSATLAGSAGYNSCSTCRPELQVRVDTPLIDSTVSTVNSSIGLGLGPSPKFANFSTDMLDRRANYGSASHHRSQSTVGSSKDYLLSAEGLQGSAVHTRPRRASIAGGQLAALTHGASDSSAAMTRPRRGDHKGDGDHARLVDDACRHIATAAAAAASQAAAQSSSDEEQPATGATRGRRSSISKPLRRKKRRGGILGFKELASKAGLSPWHFHRVFRSVTGLTPKAYGEACWEVLTSSSQPPENLTEAVNAKVGLSLGPSTTDASQAPTTAGYTSPRARFGSLSAASHSGSSVPEHSHSASASPSQLSNFSLSPESFNLQDESSVPPPALTPSTIVPDNLVSSGGVQPLDFYLPAQKQQPQLPVTTGGFEPNATSTGDFFMDPLVAPVTTAGWDPTVAVTSAGEFVLSEPELLGQNTTMGPMVVPEGTLPGDAVGPMAGMFSGLGVSPPITTATEPMSILESSAFSGSGSAPEWIPNFDDASALGKGSKDPFLPNTVGTPLTEWVEPTLSS